VFPNQSFINETPFGVLHMTSSTANKSRCKLGLQQMRITFFKNMFAPVYNHKGNLSSRDSGGKAREARQRSTMGKQNW